MNKKSAANKTSLLPSPNSIKKTNSLARSEYQSKNTGLYCFAELNNANTKNMLKFMACSILYITLMMPIPCYSVDIADIPQRVPVKIYMNRDTTTTCNQEEHLYATRRYLSAVQSRNQNEEYGIESASIASATEDSLMVFLILKSKRRESYKTICIPSKEIARISPISQDNSSHQGKEYQNPLSDEEKQNIFLGTAAIVLAIGASVYIMILLFSGMGNTPMY